MSSQLSCASLPAGACGKNESMKVQRELGGGREGKVIERRGLGEKTKGELKGRRKKYGGKEGGGYLSTYPPPSSSPLLHPLYVTCICHTEVRSLVRISIYGRN